MTALEELIQEVEYGVAHFADPSEAGRHAEAALHSALASPDLLSESQRLSSPTGFQPNVLHVAPDGAFSIVAIVWLPDQRTPIHDHLAWCVVGVYEGEEYETRYRLADEEQEPALAEMLSRVNRPGETCCMVPPDDIHQVENRAGETTISIHIYGTDYTKKGSSILRTYDLPVRVAEPD